MSSALNVFVDAIRKRSKKCLVQKVARFGSLRPIPMIQAPLDSSTIWAWNQVFPSSGSQVTLSWILVQKS